MKNEEKNITNKERMIQYAPVIGGVLVISGVLLFLDQRLRTNWLSISIPVFVGACLVISGLITRRRLWLIPGYILLGIGLGLFFGFQRLFDLATNRRICYAMASNGVAWVLMFGSILLMRKPIAWWSLFIAAISSGLAIVFSLDNPKLLDFVLSISVGISCVFLAWGLFTRTFGLIIPGALISTMGAGVYLGWKNMQEPQGLLETGTMLVWFALGWILITVLSRVIYKKFTWWPLIPGGVFLMVGSGLYIGGNPANALGFLGNTGSIGLVLFGIYLILLKFGMKQ